MTPEQRAALSALLGEETARAEERPMPPKAGRDPICDTCGKAEGDCRRIPPGVSGHKFTLKKTLTTRPDPRPTRAAPDDDLAAAIAKAKALVHEAATEAKREAAAEVQALAEAAERVAKKHAEDRARAEAEEHPEDGAA